MERGLRATVYDMSYRVIVTTVDGTEEIYSCPTPEAAGELIAGMYGDDEVQSITGPDFD